MSDRTPDEVWAATPRPRVSRGTFDRRVRMGWDPVRAATTTPDGRYIGMTLPTKSRASLSEQMGGPNAELHTMLGRSRTVAQWSVTSGVSESSIRKGIGEYGSLQAFFLNIGWYPSKPKEITEDLD